MSDSLDLLPALLVCIILVCIVILFIIRRAHKELQEDYKKQKFMNLYGKRVTINGIIIGMELSKDGSKILCIERDDKSIIEIVVLSGDIKHKILFLINRFNSQSNNHEMQNKLQVL